MLTEVELRNYRFQFQESAYKALTKSSAEVSIFLSHSHKDRDLVEGFINYLANSIKIKIYVDWQDSDMPTVTNRETAHRIKNKIHDMNYFLVLATKNAMNSKWVPWEIGIADQTKPIDKIAIIPIADPEGKFHGNEYLQLYPHVEPGTLKSTGEKVLAIFDDREETGTNIRYWLTHQ
ncbi:MAG: toll/interleukin-1 receptor domain-containing protein [Anaerolineales bacterium]|nr:toll/interleukin-1 receptor domain-containing protein [Anaerolineales bacterium]